MSIDVKSDILQNIKNTKTKFLFHLFSWSCCIPEELKCPFTQKFSFFLLAILLSSPFLIFTILFFFLHSLSYPKFPDPDPKVRFSVSIIAWAVDSRVTEPVRWRRVESGFRILWLFCFQDYRHRVWACPFSAQIPEVYHGCTGGPHTCRFLSHWNHHLEAHYGKNMIITLVQNRSQK